MIEGQVALVSGGSQGIGLASVTALLAKGANVVAMSRKAEHLAEMAERFGLDGQGRLLTVCGDVRDEADVRRVINATISHFGKLDVLINSAGVSMTAKRRLADTFSQEWHRIIETNLTGTYLMCREALPHLQQSAHGYILNVQSTGAWRASPGASLYAASKFGVRALTEALLEEYRNSSVRVSSVSPGPVATTIWEHKLEPPTAEALGRMIQPADIADIFIWLLERPRHLHIPDITVTPWLAA